MVRKFKDEIIEGYKVNFIDAGYGMVFGRVPGLKNQLFGGGLNKTQAKKSAEVEIKSYIKKHPSLNKSPKVKPVMKTRTTKSPEKIEDVIFKRFKLAIKNRKFSTASDAYQEYKQELKRAKALNNNTRINKMEKQLQTMIKLRLDAERGDRMKWFSQ